MAKCPFAEQKPVSYGSSDPVITPRVGILHVDAGNASSLWAFFKKNQLKGGSGIEAHFYVRKDGGLEQYRDTHREADANYNANPFAISIETQGYGNGKWNKKQLATVKRLLKWLSKTENIPLVKVPVWNGTGFGYHIQFGSPGKWTPVAKSCPGPKRIKQFNEVLVPWMERARKAPAAPAIGKYKTLRRTNKRAKPAKASKILTYLRPGATVKIKDVDFDPKSGIWFGSYTTKLGNTRWIPMRKADVKKV